VLIYRGAAPSDTMEDFLPALGLDIIAENVVDVTGKNEKIGLDFGENATGKAGLEGLCVALTFSSGVLDEPVVDELLVRRCFEEEKSFEDGSLAFGLLGLCVHRRKERDLLALVETPQLVHMCDVVSFGRGLVDELAGDVEVEGRFAIVGCAVLKSPVLAEKAEEIAPLDVGFSAGRLERAGVVGVGVGGVGVGGVGVGGVGVCVGGVDGVDGVGGVDGVAFGAAGVTCRTGGVAGDVRVCDFFAFFVCFRPYFPDFFFRLFPGTAAFAFFLCAVDDEFKVSRELLVV